MNLLHGTCLSKTTLLAIFTMFVLCNAADEVSVATLTLNAAWSTSASISFANGQPTEQWAAKLTFTVPAGQRAVLIATTWTTASALVSIYDFAGTEVCCCCVVPPPMLCGAASASHATVA
jgi:hypothetical protein